MRLNKFTTTTSFRGYDAVPLKKIYLNKRWEESFGAELNGIAQKEGFGLCYSPYADSWEQDSKVVLKDKEKDEFLYCRDSSHKVDMNVKAEIEKDYGLTVKKMFKSLQDDDNLIDGGNCFIGKFPNGEKWMLIGQDSMLTADLDEISKLYGIDKKNIHSLYQQDYHLDMFIRPLGYPYVLINNPDMVNQNYKQLKTSGKENFWGFDPNTRSEMMKKNVKILKNCGFIPIEIAGAYNDEINFMNAVVNKHSNGSISYITNSSASNKPSGASFQKLFQYDLEKSLRKARQKDKKAPKLTDIYFIAGTKYDTYNQMMENIAQGAGGIHCITLEHPDFDAWA